MDLLSIVNEWIAQAERRIAKEVQIPLIDDGAIHMADNLLDARMHGDNDLRAAIDNILSRDPDHLAARFVALNSYYHLMTIGVRIGVRAQDDDDEAVEDHRQKVRKHLGYLVRLREETTCNDVRTIRWEITNACAAQDYSRALRLCDQLHGLLPDHEVHAGRARLHFLIGLHDTIDDDNLANWDLPIGKSPTGFRELQNSATTLLLYHTGLQRNTSRHTLTNYEQEHLRDATNAVEKALATNKKVPPSARLILARSYDAIGDGQHAARAYEQMLQRHDEFLKECEQEAEPFWTEDLSRAYISSLYSCLSNACEHDSDLTKAIEITMKWSVAYPEQLGTYERLARLHQKRGDYQTAYGWLRKEADRNPTFGEDPNISIALALGGTTTLTRISKELDAISTTHQDDCQRIASLLRDYWPTYEHLAPEAQDRWATGAWLLTSTLAQAASLATHSFAWLVELELRTTIMDKFRTTVPVHILKTNDPSEAILNKFLQRRDRLTLGQALNSIERSARARTPLLTGLREWLKYEHPLLAIGLQRLRTDKIIALRNREDHADLSITSAEAQIMARNCRDLLNLIHARSSASAESTKG